MIQRQKPIKRSQKPLKRTPIKKGPGRVSKMKKKKIEEAKDLFFGQDKVKNCQRCSLNMWRDDCAGHHKIKRSLWATASVEERERIGDPDSPKNLVAIHHHCHDLIHADLELLARVRSCSANMENGQRIK